MKNADKFKEVFGFMPGTDCCLANNCTECPIEKTCMCGAEGCKEWWDAEYQESKTVK